VSDPEVAPAGLQLGTVPGGDGPLGASNPGAARIGLLTGRVGVGKTTVAERVVGLARQQGVTYGGLLAPAMHTGCGQKVGIWGVDLRTAERRILARTDRDLGGPSIGPYSFDAAALAWSAGVVGAAIGACDLLIVDEIGKLELWQGAGLAPVLPRLAAGEANRALVLVRESLLAELQSSLGAIGQILFEVVEENRAALPAHILDRLYAP
jgi:nucleoside-triphosphatase THEP1